MHYTARHSKLLRMHLRQSRSSTLPRRRKSEFSSTYPKTMRTRCFEEHILAYDMNPKCEKWLIQQTFQEPPEPAEGEEGEEPPPPVKKLGPHEGSSNLNMRHLTPKLHQPSCHVAWNGSLAEFCPCQRHSKTYDGTGHTLLDRPCEDHCIQPRWKVHCYRKWGCLIVCVSCRGWVRMVGFLNAFFIIACFVGAALWQDGVLKLWDMVTGEELMTKAISQMTKDHRLWHDPAPRKFDSIDLMKCVQHLQLLCHCPCAARNMVRLVCRSMLLDLVAMAPGKMRYHEIIDAIRWGTTNNCIYTVYE